MEEGIYPSVYQEKQKCIKKIEYKTTSCIRGTTCLKLILLFQVTLFFGWGCYMILQSLPAKMETESPSITLRDYPSMIESEIQESRPSTDTSVIFVKPEVIIDKINNLLEGIKLMKNHNLMQNKAIVTNVPNMMETNTQNFNVQSDKNETVTISVINSSLETLLTRNLMKDIKFTKNPIPQKIFSVEYTDDVNTDKDKKFVRHSQFLEKLLNISKAIIEEKFESKNDITEDVNPLTSESQENYALDTFNKLKNLDLNVATILNPENILDHMANVDLRNTFQELKKEFSDLTKNAPQDDRDENSSLFDKINERANAYLNLDFIIWPPHKLHEFSDMSIKDLATDSSISQSSSTQEISEQIENGSSENTNERNEDKHENEDISSVFDIFLSKNQDYFDISMVTEQNVEEQSSSESIAIIKEDEKYQSMENIKNSYKSRFLQPTVQDTIESSNLNDKFEWFNAPPAFVNLGLEDIEEDISKSSEISSSLLQDTYENMDVDDIIPGSQCEITVQMGIFAVKCPGIKIDEEWIFVSPKVPAIDAPKVTNLRDLFDVYFHTLCDEDANKEFKVENISNENSDKEVTTSRDSVSKIINEIELQESNTNAKILNPLLDLSDAATVDPFDNEERIEDYPFYDYLFYDSFHDLNEEEIKQVTTTSSLISDEFDTSTFDSNKEQNPILDISGTQQEQLKINKDYSIFDNIETSSKDPKHFYASEKMLIALLKNELSNIIMQYPPTSFYENSYRKNICSIFRNIPRNINSQLWYEQYVVFKRFLEAVVNSTYSHSMNDSTYRKKRMTDDLTWQQGISIIIFKK